MTGIKKSDEEAKVATDAFKKFAEQFDTESIYGRIILEELLKAILGVKDDADTE